MPIILLLLLALAAGLLIAVAFDRFAPAKGATAAAADAMEAMVEGSRLRTWWRARMDPAMATGLALTLAVAATVIGGAVIGVLAYLIRGNDTLASIDASAAQWGDDHATELSTRMLHWVTDFGDWPIFPAIAIAVLLYEWRRAPSRYLVPFLLVVVLGDKLVTNGIKVLADRARPTLNPIAETLGPSFPSGHSSTAAAFYAAVALILARGRSPRMRALLAGAAGGIAVAVASSRVLLDVHWLSDVIAGVTLGWAWFVVCAVAFGGRRLRYADPAEKAAIEALRSEPAVSTSPARRAREAGSAAEV